jgi:hypothetical protein
VKEEGETASGLDGEKIPSPGNDNSLMAYLSISAVFSSHYSKRHAKRHAEILRISKVFVASTPDRFGF